ncbi:MAG TPA: 2-oxo-4-hydroxy-4-carboxy-5-ureidoimidazoline decarboxylase [Jiangellaceae bacterium]|jgi:2-oxo-4-hydroxy-4-carboxy-5-ureidoimidazoline decarboxylase|nr:2-oxo-4-hydroxy-4-carboxy-5-ureidoimidazoline decarboxylase [Jiangellaceae bacterium]
MGDSPAPGLQWFNELPTDAAVDVLLGVCHSRLWAAEVAAGRPYADVDALLAAADMTWMTLAPPDWLEALGGHPRIGEAGGRSAESSAREQAGVGAAAAEVQASIAAGNIEYEARFGHVFLISAEGRSAEEILASLRSRLNNDPDVEIRIAAEEHRRITRLRLLRLLA